jgi:hypothetical protein
LIAATSLSSAGGPESSAGGPERAANRQAAAPPNKVAPQADHSQQ